MWHEAGGPAHDAGGPARTRETVLDHTGRSVAEPLRAGSRSSARRERRRERA